MLPRHHCPTNCDVTLSLSIQIYQVRVQVMLGVDRLDMIKGIPQKLLAFEKFLDEHPEWADKVLLIQIAVPSRVEVPEYQVQPPLERLAALKQLGPGRSFTPAFHLILHA